MTDLPAFHQFGSDTHQLGKRSLWIYQDGHGEMLSEAFGMTTKMNIPPGKGDETLNYIAKAYADFDSTTSH